MAYLPLKSVPLPQASQRLFDAWLEDLGARLAAPLGVLPYFFRCGKRPF